MDIVFLTRIYIRFIWIIKSAAYFQDPNPTQEPGAWSTTIFREIPDQVESFAGKASCGKPETLESLVVDPMPTVKNAIKAVIDDAKLSRPQIADAMNRLALLAGIKRRVSDEVLNKWSALREMERHIRLELLYLFCCTTGDPSTSLGPGNSGRWG